MESHWNSSGFKIAPFGKGRNAIQSKHANDLVDALNMLGRIRVRGGNVEYADNGVFIDFDSDDSSLASASNPFQIYQSGSWLEYKVKTGIAITTGNPISVTGIETTLTLSSGVLRYWIYLEMTSTTAEIKKSATTLEWSSDKIPLGWVDTSTGSASSVSTAYQIVRDHIFNPCAGTTT